MIHFSFWAKNLGIITSLRLGHDNTGNNPNWLIEHVVIKNEFNGQAYKFTCGRWLGCNIDDGSTERYEEKFVKASCHLYTQRARKYKKVRAKKLVKSNKSKNFFS